jgi:hypothetical protein
MSSSNNDQTYELSALRRSFYFAIVMICRSGELTDFDLGGTKRLFCSGNRAKRREPWPTRAAVVIGSSHMVEEAR